MNFNIVKSCSPIPSKSNSESVSLSNNKYPSSPLKSSSSNERNFSETQSSVPSRLFDMPQERKASVIVCSLIFSHAPFIQLMTFWRRFFFVFEVPTLFRSRLSYTEFHSRTRFRSTPNSRSIFETLCLFVRYHCTIFTFSSTLYCLNLSGLIPV